MPPPAPNPPAQSEQGLGGERPAQDSSGNRVRQSAQTVNPPSSQTGTPRSDPRRIELSRLAIYTIGGLIAGVAIISFLLGWSFGNQWSTRTSKSGQSASRKISGHIAYLTHRGKRAADSEAVVAAFPTDRRPDEKMNAADLRPDVMPADFNPATLNAIRALGGDFARTDRRGAYEIEVSNPGKYYLLVISSHRSRRNGRQPTTREVVEIGQYVTRATELLKDNDYIWSKQFISKSLDYDHLFGNE